MKTRITKRMIALLLTVAMVISMLPLSVLSAWIGAIDPNATLEELLEHRSELADMAEEEGFGVEFELFYSVMEDMDSRDRFSSLENFAEYCNAMSDEVLLKLLGYLRKYVAAAQKVSYSDVSATEDFFERYGRNIYETYLVPGGTGGGVTAADLAQFEKTAMFTKQLPNAFYFENPQDVPNEVALTLEASPAVLAAGDDITWVIAKTNHYPEQLLTDYDLDTQVQGNRLTLTLSADEILSCAARTNEWGEDEGGYNGFYVRAYVNGYLSEPCYFAVGTGAYLRGSSSYWAKDGDCLTVDFNTDRLPEGTVVTYEWRLSKEVPDYILQGTYDDSSWDPVYTNEPVLTKEAVIEALGEEWWDDLYFMACNISWEVFGETHSLCTPIMAVFGAEDGVRELDDPDWTFEPISVFEVFKDGGYLEPGTVINSNVFTLSDNTTLDCHVYHRRDDNYYDRTYISRQGTTFTVPAASNEHYSQETIFVEYFATAPDGTVYEGMSRSFDPYPEGVLVYVDSGRSDQIYDESALHKYVSISGAKTNIFVPNTMALYYNGALYTTDAYYASKRLKVDWYTNTVKSYEGATKHSSNTISFNAAPDTLGEHYIYCVVYASDFSYTSEIFTYTVIDPTTLTANLYSISSDGMLYQVFSSDEKVVIPETINGITVKSIGGSAFSTDYYGKDRCPNMTELILPDTVERLYSFSIPRSLTYVDIGDGIKYLDHNWGEVPELTITDTMEKIWFSNVETLNVESAEALDKLSQFVEYYLYGSLSVGKLVLPEGLEIIGQGGLDYELWVDELVLPTTLRVFKPVKPVYVGTSMVLPENLEVFDAGVNIDEWGYISMNFEYGGDTLVFPENLTTLGYLGRLYNMTQPPLPEGVMPGEFAFFGSAIESYTVPADMTVIPRYLFAQSSLTEIVIPDGVTEIGEGAFADCGNLERIVIPASVTKIGKNAFRNCYSLREVIIEGVVESIGAYAFQDCGSLETIEIQDGLKRIEDGVFTGCYGITSLDFLPDSVSYIGNNAFRYSGLMGHIALPEGVLSIGYNVFEGTSMESIQLNERLRDIGDKAFYGTYITEITIPDSVVRIGRRAFMYVPLEKVTFGENVEFIGAYAFYGTYLTAFQIPAKLTKLLAGVIADTQITEINLAAEGVGTITYVGPFAFSDTGIQCVVFPETVTYIGRGVCWNCWNLETVVLPSQISVIRDHSFAGCDALLSVQIPAPLERVDEMAFAYCSQLNGITLPDSLRIVGNRAFMECYSLEIEKLPASLIYIEDFAFNGTKLQIAELGEKVIYVGKGAFKDCVELQSVVLNEGLLTIEDSAFEGCVLLTELKIPDTVEKVGDYFINGTAIEIIELPDGLRFIPYFAGNTVIREVICPSNQIQFLWAKTFEGCTSLEIADVYSGERIGYDCFKGCVSLKYFHAYYKTTLIGDSAFEGCAAMQLITFGGEDSQLETIGEKAFSGCVGITELKLPKTLQKIGSRAFERTSITSIIVPSLVQSIGTGPIYTEMGVLSGYGDSCFYDCPELERIVFTEREGYSLAIYDFAQYCPKLAEVYLPSSVGAVYTYNGFDMDIFEAIPRECWLKNYNQALLPGYVPTAYYRYGLFDSDQDYSGTEFPDTLYKPGDTRYVIPFTSDYDAALAYVNFLQTEAQVYQDAGFGSIYVPQAHEYAKPITLLQDFGIVVMAGDEDISDKVQINWYINWLENNILTTGAMLDGAAMVCDTFRYRFTVTLNEDYAFDYEDYASEEFALDVNMDGKRIVVNLIEREKGDVQIVLPDEVKNDPSLRVDVYQTLNNLLRELETTMVDGKVTLRATPSANLLVYVWCDDYYKYTGSVSGEDIGTAMEDGTACVLNVQLKPLAKTGSYGARFYIFDALPQGEGIEEKLTSFDGIDLEIRNETRGTICENYTLQYPYIIINDYESFFELTDRLTMTVTADESLEMYGFDAVLHAGNPEEYGTTEGTFTRYSSLYITPTLPENSASNRAVVQVFNHLGNRCSIDVMQSGELLIRRFPDGKYTVTVSEQNYYLNAVDRLLQFTYCGWTEGEDYFRQTVELEAPSCTELAVEVPSAPESSFLLESKPFVSKEYKQYSQWWNYDWPYYTFVRLDVQLNTEYNLKNTRLVLSFPADLELFHVAMEGRGSQLSMVYDQKYYLEDGETVCYEYVIDNVEQLKGHLGVYLSLRPENQDISYENITDEYCVATILTDATVDGVTERHYVPVGSVCLLDEQMLSTMVQISHSPTVSKRTGISAMVTAPAGAEVDLYADGELVAQGKANYTGVAVLRYDVPFDWFWWEYDVHAVVRFANSGIVFTTDPVSVEFNEDLSSPIDIVGTIEIVDDQEAKLVFPNAYDTENIISVNFKTGDRTNIKMQSALNSSKGKTYTIYETFRVRFDENEVGHARNVMITIQYQDEFSNSKTEYLPTQYEESSGSYVGKKTIRSVRYDAAKLLQILQLPTHMGVEWDTSADAAPVVLMPGQMEILGQKLMYSEQPAFIRIFGSDNLLASSLDAMRDPVKTDPLFSFYPAQMQADILSEYQAVDDFQQVVAKSFNETFGFRVNDISEEDFLKLVEGGTKGTIEEGVTAASLREQGYSEIPVYGYSDGVFMRQEGDLFEVYDFSSNYHLTYDSAEWMDIMDRYIPASNKHSVKKKRSAAQAEDGESLSKYVENIHDKGVAEIIDSTIDQYLDHNDVYESWIAEFCENYAKSAAEMYGDSLWSYLFGNNNPLLNAAGNQIDKFFDFLANDTILSNLEWDWDKDRLINQYLLPDGTPYAEVTPEGQKLLADNQMYTVAHLLGDALNDVPQEVVGGLTALYLNGEFSDALYKAYSMTPAGEADLIKQLNNYGTQWIGSNRLTVSAGTYRKYKDIFLEGERSGLFTMKPEMLPDDTTIWRYQVQSLVKGVSNQEALHLAAASDMVADQRQSFLYREMRVREKLVNWGNQVTGTKTWKSLNGKLATGALTGYTALVDALGAFVTMSDKLYAIDAMRLDYAELVEKMSVLGEAYANVYEVRQATLYNDQDKMECFSVMPLYEPAILDELYDTDGEFREMYNEKLAERYGSIERLNQLFTGQAFVWRPHIDGYYTKETGFVETDRYYSRDTIVWGFEYAAPQFNSYQIYYKDRMPKYLLELTDLEKALYDAMLKLKRLCDQYKMEIDIETAHCFTSLMSAIPLKLATPVQIITDTAIDGSFLVGGQDWMGLGYDHLFSKDNRINYAKAEAKVEETYYSFEQKKYDIRYAGDAGTGYFLKDGFKYVCVEEALDRWNKMVEANWANLEWYPSGRYDGIIWDESHFEEEIPTGGVEFTEEEALVDLKLMQDGEFGDIVGDLEYEMPCIDPLIDPAGFIYEAVLSNRVDGATVSIYYEDENGNAVLWDAENYGQTSTIITAAGGYYSWLTPPGNWKVVAQKDGYLMADTTNDPNAVDGWLPVPPPQLDINIGLVTTLAPAVAAVEGYTEGVLVRFSQYMDIASFDGMVTLTVDGEQVPCVLSFTDQEVSATEADVYYGRNLMISRLDGEILTGNVTVTINGSVQNYAGIALGSDYTSEALEIKQLVQEIYLPCQTVTVKTGEQVQVEGKLLDATGKSIASRRVVLSILGAENAQLVNEIVYTDHNGWFTFSVKGISIGFTVIQITPEHSALTAELTVKTDMITAENRSDFVKSDMPVVSVLNPDETSAMDSITQDATVTLLPGSKLMVNGSVAGEIGYCTDGCGGDPWMCASYKTADGFIPAEELTYRFVYRENGKVYSDVLTVKVKLDTTHVHTIEFVSAKEAVCPKLGNIAHYACTGCGMLFKDAAGTEVITDRSSVYTERVHATPVITNHGDTHSLDWPCCDTLDQPAASHHFEDGVCVCGATSGVSFGWTEEEGNWYYIDAETGLPVTGIVRVPYPTQAINGITYAPNAEDVEYYASKGQTFMDKDAAWFVFGENGVFQSDLTGLTNDNRWAVSGHIAWHIGLTQIGEDYYYFIGDVDNGGNKIAVGDVYVSRNTTTFDMVVGGVYTFGADGKLCMYNGITEVAGVLRYYENYRLMMGNGLTQVGGNYIYVNSKGELIVDAEYYIPGNDLGIATGMYHFDESGFMVQPVSTDKDGVYFENGAWYYYENGKIGYGKGMMAYNGGYIYVRSNGQLAVGTYYITNVPEELSGLFHLGQKVIFDDNGMAQAAQNGIYEVNGELYFFADNQIQYNAGLIEWNGGYIYIRSSGKVAIGKYWITNTNGKLDQGYYEFGADGYMIINDTEDGIVDEAGTLYYYEEGRKLYGTGLKQLSDGSYIYIRTNGELATGSYWITNHNGLLPEQIYIFGEDGKLVTG